MTVTEAGIESARVQMENAMREDTRFKKLLSQDAVTQQQYDKVHTGYLSAKQPTSRQFVHVKCSRLL